VIRTTARIDAAAVAVAAEVTTCGAAADCGADGGSEVCAAPTVLVAPVSGASATLRLRPSN